MLKIVKFTFNPLGENTYVFHNGKIATVIDPGMYEDYEQEQFSKFLEKEGLELDKIVCTHCHLDHVAGVEFLKNKYNVSCFIPSGEQEILKMSEISAGMYGMHLFQNVGEVNHIEGVTIELAGLPFQILKVPGHSPDHYAFYNADEKVVASGDVLFKGSIGRYDLPGGSLDVLRKSILEVLFELPDDVQVLCGHGELTTIGFEKKHNVITTI